MALREPEIAAYLDAMVVRHLTLESALAYVLAVKLGVPDLPATALSELFGRVHAAAPALAALAWRDLLAVVERDPATDEAVHPFLNHKGFHAVQAHRAAHWLWHNGRRAAARHLQGRSSEVFAVDIHPAASLGGGLFVDHATGVVIGETTVVGDDVSILQGVTLGGTGKETGDRHPKIGPEVLLCAGAKILGNVRVGQGAKVGASSVVLKDVPPHCTVVGVPARVVGRPLVAAPSRDMEQRLDLECE